MQQILSASALAAAVFLVSVVSAAGGETRYALSGSPEPSRVEKRLDPHASASLTAKSLETKNNRRACGYEKLDYGPIVDVFPSDKISLSPDQSFILIQDKFEDSYNIYFLDGILTKEFHKKGGDSVLIINDQEVGVDENGSFRALNVRSGAKRQASPRERIDRGVLAEDIGTLNSGKKLSITRLYANAYVLKISPGDTATYEEFRSDILRGYYCGVQIGALSPTKKRQIKPLIMFMLLDSLSDGKLDDYQSWLTYRNVFLSFL